MYLLRTMIAVYFIYNALYIKVLQHKTTGGVYKERKSTRKGCMGMLDMKGWVH